ncbi:hypothetical protein LCGC14_2463740, partial [marine sediment metagenome]
GEDGREILRRDLNTKANTLKTAQEITSEAHARIVGIDVLEALSQNESATSLITRIRNDDEMSSIRKKDMEDLVGIISRDREKGLQPISADELRANHTFSEEVMKTILAKRMALTEDETGKIDIRDEKKRKALFNLIDQGMTVLSEATQLAVKGQFNKDNLVDLGFQMTPLTEGLFIFEAEKKGFLAGLFSGPSTKRVPNAIIADVRKDMFLGEGTYGGFTPAQRTVMGRILTSEAIKTKGSRQPMEALEAMALANDVFERSEKIFLSEEFGLIGDDAERVGGLIFKSGTPATEARQQPLISGIADSIRQSLALGRTMTEIEEFMRGEPGFTQEAFDQAAATIQVVQ